MAFYNDVKNIIDNLVHRYRLDRLNGEYRNVFRFFDHEYDYKCPNSQRRCIGRYRNANIHWFNGRYHGPLGGGPAIEYANGDKLWYYKNQLHREDGPAIEWGNGTKHWYFEGDLHREDGPAIEYANGDKVWFLNDQRHRKDGPAIEWANGTKEWYLNNQRHRDSKEGPAIEYVDGSLNEYWEFGNRIQ